MPTLSPDSDVTLTLAATDGLQVSTDGLAYVDLLAGAPGSPHDSRRIDPATPARFGPYGVTAVLRVRAAKGLARYVTTADAVPAARVAGGARTVLFGDSETDVYEFSGSGASALAYDAATGVLTATHAAHGAWTGRLARLWNYNYASLRDQRILPLTRTGANSYTLTLEDRPSDLPANLAATLFANPIGGQCFAHWLALAQMRLGQPLAVVRNAAQSGDTSVGCLGRFDRDVAAWSPALVVMQLPGLNDQSSTNAIPLQTTLSANRQIIDRVLGIGARLLLLTTNPVVSGEARGNLATMQRIRQINADALAYCRDKAGVAVVDAYARVVDPADATGYAVAAYFKGDKTHWNYTGSQRVAPAVQAVLRAWYPWVAGTLVKTAVDCHNGSKLTVSSMSRAADGQTVTYTASAAHNRRAGEAFRLLGVSAAENGVFVIDDVPTASSLRYRNPGAVGAIAAGGAVLTFSDNAWNNPLFLTATGGTTGNGVTGTAAARLTVTNLAGNTGTLTAAASVPAAPDGEYLPGVGNEQRITITAAGVNDRPLISTVGTSAMTSEVLPGRVYQLDGRLRITSTDWARSVVSEIRAVLDIAWSTGEAYSVPVIGGWDGAESPTIASDQDWHFKSAPIGTPVPQAGATIASASWSVYVRFNGAWTAGQATFVMAVSQVSCRDVTGLATDGLPV